MEKILIENFGPITKFEADMNCNLTVLIGEQATGKSTVAKCIFFGKSVKEELYSYILSCANREGCRGNLFGDFLKILRGKFMNFFGTTKHMDKFTMRFFYDKDQKCSIKILLEKDGYAKFWFSPKLKENVQMFLKKTMESMQQDQAHLRLDDLELWQNNKKMFLEEAKVKINALFFDECKAVFIPAGRSLVAINSEFFHELMPNKYDRIMKDFIERIALLQKRFFKHIDDLIEDKKKLSNDKINFSDVELAKELVVKILKGEYVKDFDGEKIFYDSDKFVKLYQASSGQQESLWILMLIFSIILDNEKVFLVVEEPEAHLYPNAQQTIIELIALLINSTDSRVLITTHSPYILASLNLLMYSHKVENNQKKETIISRKFRINGAFVKAAMLKKADGFCYENLIDPDSGLIFANKIDCISEDINDKIEKLIDIEVQR